MREVLSGVSNTIPVFCGFDMFPEIPQTKRLRLRAYTNSDEAELFDVFADPYARRFYPEMAERANVRAWIEWNLRNYGEFGFGLWAVELKAEGQLIGDCGLTYPDVEGRRELEIGYHVIERERSKGYATEAARECVDFGFARTSCESICSIVRPSNAASCAVAARVHTARREFMKGGRLALLLLHQPPGLGGPANDRLSGLGCPQADSRGCGWLNTRLGTMTCLGNSLSVCAADSPREPFREQMGSAAHRRSCRSTRSRTRFRPCFFSRRIAA